MNDRNRRSAAEVMTNAARVVKAAVNIVRAAIAGGLHGAAAAARWDGFLQEAEEKAAEKGSPSRGAVSEAD